MREASDSELSDITEINSDDELPSDSIGDYSIISLKGVLKEIISCGSGYEKPSIGDELLIEFESSNKVESSNGSNTNTTQEGNNRLKLILGDHSMNEYDSTRKREIPWGIEMALRKMLKGEKSKILVRKGSVFSKPRDLYGKICSNSIINVEDYKNYNNRSKKLINLIKKEVNEFDTFTITLHDFYRIEMICDKVNKKIWKKGVHLKSPNKKDKVELLISKLQFETILDNFAKSPKLCNLNSGLEWIKVSLNLDKLSESNKKIKEIFGNKTFSMNEFIHCILSMKLGEISEFRIYSTDKERLNILIHLTGFHWEKNIPIKLPFNKEVQNNNVKLSSFESESLYNDNSSLKEGKLSSKRISSLNLEHNTRINILLEKFTLVDNAKQGKRIELSLPFKFTENIKTALLQVTPGFYNLPIWLEQSILYCFLGGKYTLKIPFSIIFLFPPSELQVESKSIIQSKTNSIIFENNNLSTSNSNACNNNASGNLHAIWEARKLIRELENMGYNIDNNVEKDLGVVFELNLSIFTREVVENYIPTNSSNAKMEFEYYYNLGRILNSYNDIIYKTTWNVLALEVFDKILHVVVLLPFYSKLAYCEQSNSDVKLKIIEKENMDNFKSDKNRILHSQNQKSIILKYNNFVEDINSNLTNNQDTDSILVSHDILNRLEHQEKEHLESFVSVINIILKIYYDMQQFEKCLNLLEKYKFLLEFKSTRSSIGKLSTLKNFGSNNNTSKVKDLSLKKFF
ncbi:Peptidylprolyl isomerase [Cryptosporidium sp. chipmunk genotype I]|uniref:Peptidylprolyl isomerase n=1 Tax=Cryptosporidium sp. chipmunk genotype I TaxID=1280935 RepID=UPI00351A56D2|nr:Peptidylprolyl isomerase [Cryptosporidium sp. chipmunk genotype I]